MTLRQDRDSLILQDTVHSDNQPLSIVLYSIDMSPRPDDVRLKQLQREKTERIKRGIDKLERHSGN